MVRYRKFFCYNIRDDSRGLIKRIKRYRQEMNAIKVSCRVCFYFAQKKKWKRELKDNNRARKARIRNVEHVFFMNTHGVLAVVLKRL